MLFDDYVLESCKLLEFSQLVSMFGFDSVLELVKSRSITIKCDANLIGVFGDTEDLVRKGKSLEFDFTYVRAANHEEYLSSCLQKIPTNSSLTPRQRIKLKQALAVRVDKAAGMPPAVESPELKAIRNFLAEASSNVPNVKRSCALELKERHGVIIQPEQFSLIIHRPSQDLLKAETDLHKLVGLDLGQTHDVIKYSLLRMSGISERFGIMERYTALTGLNNIDLPVFEGRYEFFADQISANRDKSRLNRLLEIEGFPNFEAIAAEGRLRLDKILEIRETHECRDFRTWLKQIDRMSDEEIRDQIESFRSAVGNFMGRTSGKIVRLLVSNGVGAIPAVGPLIGLAASVVDSFLVDKLFPSSGPISFINRRLPSVFEMGGKKQNPELETESQHS
ncbi:MAG TPA: hypothetical protein VMS31_10005 [Pyrinomonadaceae bacterium]|nr:hypothetical protein [Pyrinomonadaceae bacterium]